MSSRAKRTQTPAWSLFPQALNLPGTNSTDMNLHQPRRLSPIPRSDETESEYGAEVKDIPFYRPEQKSLDRISYESPRTSETTHELAALLSPAVASMHTHVSNRTSSRQGSESGSRESILLPDDIQAPDFEVSSKQVQRDPRQNSVEMPIPTSHLDGLRFPQERPDSRNHARRDMMRSPEPLEKSQSQYERPDSRNRNRRQAPLLDSVERPEYAQEQRENFHKHQRGPNSGMHSPSTNGSRSMSRASERASYQTDLTSLPPLQQKNLDEHDQLEPLNEEDLDPGSFDLVAPAEEAPKQYSLEARSELLFSTEHLQTIFADPSLLLKFTAFLSFSRTSSIPILIYYLDAIKALKAISYSNAIAEALEPMKGFDFTNTVASKTTNIELEAKAKQAFDVMVREDLPAYITHTYIQTVSLSIQRRITGTLPPYLREASEGLAEVFCLTDPSRPDNPIVFASEEFHRTTQYGMSYVIGRNCRFLQGPKTNLFSVRRIREMVEAGKEHYEVFLNYRRDGSPFMNLLMCSPLCDSRGTIRYFIGAQVDVSGLVKECSDLESLNRLATKSENPGGEDEEEHIKRPAKDEFHELSEMLNLQELDTVRRWGGRMHKEHQEEPQDSSYRAGNWAKPRVLISSGSPDDPIGNNFSNMSSHSGKLGGIYENYLLVRPYPSLRILFASPTLRVPGILQSPFMAKIGGSDRVRHELTQALADGRGVTAKVKWVSKTDTEGRNRWIHCTPLLGNNGAIGVWMIVIVDDEQSQSSGKRFKMAPPVDPKFGRAAAAHHHDSGSLKDFALSNGGRDHSLREPSLRHPNGSIRSNVDTERSGSPYTLRID